MKNKPKYYYKMYLYVSQMSCPQLDWLKLAIKQVDKEREERRREYEKCNDSQI